MIQKYRKKPVTIEAVQYFGDLESYQEIKQFVGDLISSFGLVDPIIKTLEGAHVVSPGDFVIKGIEGEFYPCKPDIFDKTYEKVEE